MARLGRVEEALLESERLLSQGEGANVVVQILAEAERYEDLVRFVDERFESFAALEANSDNRGYGAAELGILTYALRMTGDERRAEAALGLFRETLAHQQREGSDNASFHWSMAYLRVLEGDLNSSLDELDRAISMGYLEESDFPRYWAAFRPLRSEPRFQALITRMNTARNEQRALLDLPPIDIDS